MKKLVIEGSKVAKNETTPMFVVGSAPSFIVDTCLKWQNQMAIGDPVLS
jgi:hypothetical protein